MFGFFSKKKKDAKPADKAAGKKSDIAKKAAAPAGQKPAKPADKKPAKTPDSLKAAIAAMEAEAPSTSPEKPVSAGLNLDKAREALAKKAAGPMDRKALIEQALAIQQTQAKMLDKLPDETRQKLRAMAMKAFVIDQPADKKKMN